MAEEHALEKMEIAENSPLLQKELQRVTGKEGSSILFKEQVIYLVILMDVIISKLLQLPFMNMNFL